MLKFAATLVVAVLVASGPPIDLRPALAAPVGSDVGGILTDDTTWTSEDGPYNLTSTVQIPAGVTLTIEPGVSVTRDADVSLWFLLHGDIKIQGSPTEPVRITGGVSGTNGTGILFGFDQADADVLVEYADIRNIHELIYNGDGAGSLTITDSRIMRSTVRAGAYGLYGPTILRNNEFINDGSFNVDPRYFPVVIEHNRWIRTTDDERERPTLWLFAGATVNNNTFASGDWAAIGTLRPFSDMPTTVNAENNYWGTTDATQIASRIYDSTDSISNDVTADFEPFLTAPAPGPVFAPTEPQVLQVTASNESVAVLWSAPASDGGSPLTEYIATASPGGKTCTSSGASSCTITGLTNGTSYSVTVSAANAIGSSQPSGPSNTVIPAGVPNPPSAPVATPGDGRADVSWSAAPDNGSPITSYTAVAAPGGQSCTMIGALTCTIAGLVNGTTYTFTVAATNAVGTGAASSPSNPVTPQSPFSQPPSTTPPVTPLTYTPAPLPNPQTPAPTTAPAPTAPGKVLPPKVAVKGKKAIVIWRVPYAGSSPVTRFLVDLGRDKGTTTRSTKIVLKGLKPGRHRVRVAAQNAVGKGSYSAWTTFRIR